MAAIERMPSWASDAIGIASRKLVLAINAALTRKIVSIWSLSAGAGRKSADAVHKMLGNDTIAEDIKTARTSIRLAATVPPAHRRRQIRTATCQQTRCQ